VNPTGQSTTAKVKGNRTVSVRFATISRSPREAGFGMIEIVVSMLLLSLLAIAFLPMLVTSLKVSISNSTLASATQLVAAEMANMRSLGTTCSDLADYAAVDPDVFAPDGRALQAHVDISCSGTYPDTAPVSVYVTEVSTGATLAEATTSIFVNG
jgi:type II secretory pathway pseudopilin PulG